MQKYKVGDRVAIHPTAIGQCGVFETHIEAVGIEIIGLYDDGINYHYNVIDANGNKLAKCERCLKEAHMAGLLNQNQSNNIMGTIIDKVRQMRLKEPEKSFVKAGIANTDGTLTKDGEQLFNEWMFEKNKADFNNEVVQPLLAEIEKEEA